MAHKSCDWRVARRPPKVYVALIQGARNHILHTWLAVGVFRPDIYSNQEESAKHLFLGFTIKFMNDHLFTDPTGGLVILPPHDYQGKSQWHDGR